MGPTSDVDPTPADDAPRVADFPDTPLAAAVGQWVFAPTRASLDETRADPEYRAPYYGQAEVVEVGPAVSTVCAAFGDPEVIPNAYLVPIPPEQPVAPGDVVLASLYGNSMELACVTEAGAAPKADFVTILPYAEPHPGALAAGRFLVLDGALRPGAHAAVRTPDARPRFAIVVATSGERVLLSGFMGTVIVADVADVTPLEVDLRVAPGDRVTARASSGDMLAATVHEVDASGRIVRVVFDDLPTPEPVPLPRVHVTRRLPLA